MQCKWRLMPFFVHRDLDDNHVTRFYSKNAVRGRRKEFAPRLLTMTIHPVLGLRLLSAWCSRAETMTTDGAYSIDVGLRLLAVTINLMVGL